MTQNKVKKFFSLVEIWAFCDICKEMINLKVDKDEIKENLELGIYTKEYAHMNPYPDPDDLDDRSTEEHKIFVYINEDYDVTGVKSFFGETMSMDELKAEEPGEEVRVPIIVKDVDETSVMLGMISKEQYKLLKICDGMNTISDVAKIAQKNYEETEKMLEELRDKGLIKVIIRR
ncbi:MAG: hypothetical protein EU548_02145 [Promethearchaeota archaeon]|nr:MAG: hypothetical protein EU548_02145 [Candidatus Lokiarchaeota archaeon]